MFIFSKQTGKRHSLLKIKGGAAMRRNEKGFTLVELMIVVAIVGAMSIMAFPTFSGWIARARLRDAARTVYSDMQLARIRAIESGGRWRVFFTPDEGTYTVVDPGPDMILDTEDDIEKTVNIFETRKGIVFGTDQGSIPDAADPPDDGVSFTGERVEFLPMGRANKGGTVYLKNERGETFAVVLSFNNARLRLIRNYGGGWEG
jgi:type IV fimbrial biogenesis protein FimT